MAFYTHDLAFALACANAIGLDNLAGSANWAVIQPQIEQQLWALQGTDGTGGTGGLWNMYCDFNATPNCAANPYPNTNIATGIAQNARMLNEDAAVVLAGYGPNVW
jgi:hypothetical protein